MNIVSERVSSGTRSFESKPKAGPAIFQDFMEENISEIKADVEKDWEELNSLLASWVHDSKQDNRALRAQQLASSLKLSSSKKILHNTKSHSKTIDLSEKMVPATSDRENTHPNESMSAQVDESMNKKFPASTKTQMRSSRRRSLGPQLCQEETNAPVSVTESVESITQIRRSSRAPCPVRLINLGASTKDMDLAWADTSTTSDRNSIETSPGSKISDDSSYKLPSSTCSSATSSSSNISYEISGEIAKISQKTVQMTRGCASKNRSGGRKKKDIEIQSDLPSPSSGIITARSDGLTEIFPPAEESAKGEQLANTSHPAVPLQQCNLSSEVSSIPTPSPSKLTASWHDVSSCGTAASSISDLSEDKSTMALLATVNKPFETTGTPVSMHIQLRKNDDQEAIQWAMGTPVQPNIGRENERFTDRKSACKSPAHRSSAVKFSTIRRQSTLGSALVNRTFASREPATPRALFRLSLGDSEVSPVHHDDPTKRSSARSSNIGNVLEESFLSDADTIAQASVCGTDSSVEDEIEEVVNIEECQASIVESEIETNENFQEISPAVTKNKLPSSCFYQIELNTAMAGTEGVRRPYDIRCYFTQECSQIEEKSVKQQLNVESTHQENENNEMIDVSEISELPPSVSPLNAAVQELVENIQTISIPEHKHIIEQQVDSSSISPMSIENVEAFAGAESALTDPRSQELPERMQVDVSAVVVSIIRDTSVPDIRKYISTLNTSEMQCKDSCDSLLQYLDSYDQIARGYADEAVAFYMSQTPQFATKTTQSSTRSRGAKNRNQTTTTALWDASDIIAIACLTWTRVQDLVSMQDVLSFIQPFIKALSDAIGKSAADDCPIKESRSGKLRVQFCEIDGSALSPPNDRFPTSWETMHSYAITFLKLIQQLDCLMLAYIAKECNKDLVNRAGVASLLAATAMISDADSAFMTYLLKKIPLSTPKAALASLGKSIYEELSFSITKNYSDNQVSRGESIVFSTLTNPRNIDSHTSRSGNSNLRLRVSWMNASVSRFILRYIFDAEPYQISAPGLRGAMDYSDSRSGLHNTFQLCKRGPRRMRQLCIPTQSSKDNPLVVLADGEHSKEKVLAALPSPLDVDPAEIATSTLLIRALKQLLRLVLELSEAKNVLSYDIFEVPCIAQALHTEAAVRTQGLTSDLAQIVLAAEYARRFICELCCIPGLGNVLVPTVSKRSCTNAWAVLSDSAKTLSTLAVSEDAYLQFFANGWSAFEARIQEPLVSSAFITECQEYFHQCLAQDAYKRRDEKLQISLETHSRDSCGEDSFDSQYFRLVHLDSILDFPQIRLICEPEEDGIK